MCVGVVICIMIDAFACRLYKTSHHKDRDFKDTQVLSLLTSLSIFAFLACLEFLGSNHSFNLWPLTFPATFSKIKPVYSVS